MFHRRAPFLLLVHEKLHQVESYMSPFQIPRSWLIMLPSTPSILLFERQFDLIEPSPLSGRMQTRSTASRSDYRIGESAICQWLRDTDGTISMASARLNDVGPPFEF